ncbi:hypothetical protein M3Y99_00652200 [Aphelenchoides fujianensis]|nr:hypothetical protein M3Y99_00652200 [Aphelenchoides fujianensis]
MLGAVVPNKRDNGSPLVIEVWIGSPPQRVNVALIFRLSESAVFDRLLLFDGRTKRADGDGRPCGRTSGHFDPAASRSFVEEKRRTELPGVFSGRLFAETVSIFPNEWRRSPVVLADFVRAPFGCAAEVGGFWPLDVYAKAVHWTPLLRPLAAPIVTLSTDRSPAVPSAVQTGRLFFGGLDEERCGKKAAFKRLISSSWWFHSRSPTINGTQTGSGIVEAELDLNRHEAEGSAGCSVGIQPIYFEEKDEASKGPFFHFRQANGECGAQQSPLCVTGGILAENCVHLQFGRFPPLADGRPEHAEDAIAFSRRID